MVGWDWTENELPPRTCLLWLADPRLPAVAARGRSKKKPVRDIGVALDRKIAWLATQPPPEPPLAATSPEAPLDQGEGGLGLMCQMAACVL